MKIACLLLLACLAPVATYARTKGDCDLLGKEARQERQRIETATRGAARERQREAQIAISTSPESRAAFLESARRQAETWEREAARAKEAAERLEREEGACRQMVAAEEALREEARQTRATEEAARQEVRRARAARIAARQDDPQWLVPLLSAELCWYQKDRRDSLTAIAKERKYGRIGGVVDGKALHDWQGDIRRADEQMPIVMKRLRALKAKPLACSGKVAELVACLNGPLGGIMETPPDHCSEAPASEYLELLAE